MARFKWTGPRILMALVLVLISPVLYILGFNYLLGSSIALSVDNWLFGFLASLLTVILFAALELVAYGAGKAWGPLGMILAIIGIVLLPILFIFSFNLLLSASVPYTVVTYILAAALMIGVWLIHVIGWKAVA